MTGSILSPKVRFSTLRDLPDGFEYADYLQWNEFLSRATQLRSVFSLVSEFSRRRREPGRDRSGGRPLCAIRTAGPGYGRKRRSTLLAVTAVITVVGRSEVTRRTSYTTWTSAKVPGDRRFTAGYAVEAIGRILSACTLIRSATTIRPVSESAVSSGTNRS